MPDELCKGCRELEARVARLERAAFGGEGRAPSDAPASPLARSMVDLATPAQLGNIRRLARKASVDPDAECRALYACDSSELNRNAADALIKHLSKL
jgi:hypothetical protein